MKSCDIETHKPYEIPDPRMTCYTHNMHFRRGELKNRAYCPAVKLCEHSEDRSHYVVGSDDPATMCYGPKGEKASR